MTIIGEPEACRKQMQAFFDAGVQEIRLVFNEPSKEAYLEALKAVAPGPRSRPMKVGVLQFFSWSRRIPLATVYERAFVPHRGHGPDRATTASGSPSTTSTPTACARRSTSWRPTWRRGRSGLRIGMAVSLAAFYNPLRLAEEVAMIDVLSGGRVNWGAGRGFDRSEFEAFGVPVEESSDRFRECVEIVLASWRQERMSYQGRFWKLRRRRGAAEAAPVAASAGLARRHVAGLDPAGGGERLRHPPGPARHARRDRREARAVLPGPARARLPGRGPRHSDRAAPRRRRPPIRRRTTWRGRARRGPWRRTRTRASARARPPPITWSPTRSSAT